MDSITQGLLGGAIGEAGYRDALGGRAVAWGALMGVAPDFDMVMRAFGEWESILHHRGVTHSWVCQTAAAPILGFLAWRFLGKRRGRWTQWAMLTWWALVTHPALDTCTAYGTQLFAPIDTYRHAIDAVAIIDPLYSLPLLLAVLFAWRGRDRARSRRVAIGALIVSTLYLAAGWGMSQRAESIAAEELAAEGFDAVEIRALPTIANIVVHRVIARDDQGGFRAAIVSATRDGPHEWIVQRDDDDPLIERAKASGYGVTYRWFAMGFARFERVPDPQGDRVIVHDLRFGAISDPSQTFMGAELLYNHDGRLIAAERRSPPTDLDIGAELDALWFHLLD